jgi:NADH dehydrogenase FAD-containing subunit
MSKSSNRKNVLIVGGGTGGAALAIILAAKLDKSKYNLVLINPLPYHIYYLATCRLTVSDVDDLENQAFIPYDKMFTNGNGTFKQGTVESIHKGGSRGGEVTLADGEVIPYHALVLATGSKWEGPLDFPSSTKEVTEWVKNQRNAFSRAKDIVIVGGGAVGIEFAGEIKDVWPTKKVTIVQGSDHLLNATYPDKYRQRLDDSVNARGIQVLFNDYVDEIPTAGQAVTTRYGKKLNADFVVNARGPKPNTQFIASSLGSSAITDRGFVKVKPTLQVEGFEDVFALGDIIDWKEQKQAAKAGNHAAVVAANVLSLLEGNTLVKSYTGSPELIVITNGKGGGVGYFQVAWGITLGDWFARMIKSKDFMLPKQRKALGYA